MLLYDTLSRSKREFRPLKGNTVRIYTCGPSVYRFSHIGNFRTYLFEDLLVRYLMYKGYKVRRVMNITDIEDKAFEAARKAGRSLADFERRKIEVFFQDLRKLGMLGPDVVAKASDYIPEMIGLIGRICRKGYCITDPDAVYFDVRKFREYGKLRKLRRREYRGRMRKDDYAREALYDFQLWKFCRKPDSAWGSPWGRGRPGWHIECSAIAMSELGESSDIHCGGADNVFPHHENEIAQSEAATGKRLANFWMHARHLTVGKKKMSKRTGNVNYVQDLERYGVPPKCLRYYLISEKYRNRLDFTIQKYRWRICNCEEVIAVMRDLRKIRRKGDGERGKRIALRIISGFEKAMDDDLNTKLAFRNIFREAGTVGRLMGEGELTAADARHILGALRKIDKVLGVFRQ